MQYLADKHGARTALAGPRRVRRGARMRGLLFAIDEMTPIFGGRQNTALFSPKSRAVPEMQDSLKAEFAHRSELSDRLRRVRF